MRKKRNNYTPEEKVMILKRHLIEGEAISRICDELNLQPTVFHRWQKQFFEEGSLVFERHDQRREKQLERKIAELEAKVAKKNEVLGELMEEHLATKKELGLS